MTWTVDRVRDEWLGEAQLAAPEDDVVRLFNVVEETFGEQWLESRRGGAGHRGAFPTLSVVQTGELIEAVADLEGSPELRARLRRDEHGAAAEALVVQIVRAFDARVNVVLGPTVNVGNSVRRPDLRLDKSATSVFVEVSAAKESRESLEIRQRIDQIAAKAIEATPPGSTSELFFHREPTDEELSELIGKIGPLATEQVERVIPGDAANLVVNSCEPGNVVPYDHGGPTSPRVGTVRVETSSAGKRHAVVRYPEADERAAAFLRREAAQLPTNAPGIVVLDVTGAVGAMATWEAAVRERLHPRQHTRVSAVILLESGSYAMPRGEAWAHQAKVIINKHAAQPAPSWVLAGFQRLADGKSHTFTPPDETAV